MLRTIVRGAGKCFFFGLQVEQKDSFYITFGTNQKLNALDAFPISRARRKDGNDQLNAIEQKVFNSLNSSLGWLGISASPVYSSYPQQQAQTATVTNLISQINHLRAQKKAGMKIRNTLSDNFHSAQESILVFSDAGQKEDHSQLSVLAGLLLGGPEDRSVSHTLLWISHKSKRPIKSVSATKILAASEAINEEEMLHLSLSTLLPLKNDFILVLHSCDLFNLQSTYRNSMDRSISADVKMIRYKYESCNVSNMMWVSSKVMLADLCNKPNIPLTDALQLLLESGKLSLNSLTVIYVVPANRLISTEEDE